MADHQRQKYPITEVSVEVEEGRKVFLKEVFKHFLVGSWLLAVGSWLLAFGGWLLAFG